MSKTLKMIKKAEVVKNKVLTQKQYNKVRIVNETDIIGYLYDNGVLCNIVKGREWNIMCSRQGIPRVFKILKQLEKIVLPELMEDYRIVLRISKPGEYNHEANNRRNTSLVKSRS